MFPIPLWRVDVGLVRSHELLCPQRTVNCFQCQAPLPASRLADHLTETHKVAKWSFDFNIERQNFLTFSITILKNRLDNLKSSNPGSHFVSSAFHSNNMGTHGIFRPRGSQKLLWHYQAKTQGRATASRRSPRELSPFELKSLQCGFLAVYGLP